jgi:hypothetical protein
MKTFSDFAGVRVRSRVQPSIQGVVQFHSEDAAGVLSYTILWKTGHYDTLSAHSREEFDVILYVG